MSIEIISRHPLNQNSWVRWANPLAVYSTHERSGVGAVIDQSEAQAGRGFYAVGFATYEAGAAFDSHFMVKRGSTIFPLAWFAIFKGCEPVELPGETHEEAAWQPQLNEAGYGEKIGRIKGHISRGETYQVNFTFPLICRDRIDMRNLFARLSRIQTTPYSLFIETEDFSIASASPELFFKRDGNRIECRPMKGTCARAPHPDMDEGRGAQLQNSTKNRAENLMIVDMVRNDLGRIAMPGSVRVERLFEVTAWPTLWQMTSTVTAESSCPLRELFAALFPSASITGAPKLQTSAIIAELENNPRGLYTGAIGMIGPGRQASFSVAIRTAVQDKASGITCYGIGSGIVWDSGAASEYAECLLKSTVLTERGIRDFDLLETMRWDPADGIQFKQLHLERMKSSADYLGFPWPEAQLKEQLLTLAPRPASTSPQMVRLLLSATGTIRIETRPLAEPAHFADPDHAPEMSACIDSLRHGTDSRFLYHKTTNRQVYTDARKRFPDADEVLLVNDCGEVMEFTSGNIVVRQANKLLTPPLASGLLPGTFRQHLLNTGMVHERILHPGDLTASSAIFFINSVRGWRRIRMA